jgi:hypothetical protein
MHKNGSDPASPGREPFGQVAVRKGYVTQLQVTEALARQKDIAAAGAAHKLIGMVMLEMGALGTTELIEVLREMNAPFGPRADRRPLP